MVGAGSANVRTAYVLIRWGIKPGNIIMVDSKGILHPNRKDLKKEANPWKYDLARRTNAEGRTRDITKAFGDSDAVVAAPKPGPDTIQKE